MVHSTKAPFRINAVYPTPLQAKWIKLHNSVYNRLYPVHPAYFGASVALLTAASHHFVRDHLREWLLPTVLPSTPVWLWLRCACVGLVSAYVPVWLLRRFIKHVLYTYKGWLYESRGKISLRTKLWGFCLSLFRHARPKLHSCDGLLPSLPLPSLSDTLRRHLESVEPLMDAEEFRRMQQLSRDFETGVGPKLQFFLWLKTWTTDNYVSDWWKQYAYLYRRESVLINSSVAHSDMFRDIPATQATRAAHVAHIETASMLAFDDESLKPLGNAGVTLCANHYGNMYGVTRIPGDKIDTLRKYPLPRHIAVLSNGCFYKVEMFDGQRLLSLPELQIIFDDLLSLPADPSPGEARLSALTTAARDVWACNRRRFLTSNPANRRALEMVESAGFVLVLTDDHHDYDPNDTSKLDAYLKAMLTGNGANRWADKSLNYVVQRNGRCGGTTEHSIGDGFEFDHIFENFVFMDVHKLGYEAREWHGPRPKPAERIRFDLSEECQQEIERSYLEYRRSVDDLDLAATIFRDFGKGLLKKGNVSPDAFVQMAIQLANYQDQGKFVLTYEAASARFYANGRTETLRTVTRESCAFVKAMLDPTVSKTDQLRLLRAASERHAVRNRDVMVGKGVDRHLFALYVLSKGLGITSPFLQEVLGAPWLLSTSQVPMVTNLMDEDKNVDWSWLGACFAAVTPAGYGICYRFAGHHSICAHITSYHSAPNTDSKRFRERLINAFRQMAALFEADHK